MKTLLTYTILDKTYSNQLIKGYVALYSIFLEFQTLPLNLEVEGIILYQKRANDYTDYPKNSSRITIPEGSYSIKEFEALVKKYIPDFSFKLNK